MGKLSREAVEIRRNQLISKLLEFERYKLDEKHLYELTLTELEYIYFTFQSEVHPHIGMDSIVWKNFSKKINDLIIVKSINPLRIDALLLNCWSFDCFSKNKRFAILCTFFLQNTTN
jgi:hypothetical protein